jgi:hypothetical protein
MEHSTNPTNGQEEWPDSLTTAFKKTIEHITAERYALALLEDNFHPKPAKLAQSKADAKALEGRSSRVVASFGGPPQKILIIRANDGSDDGKAEHFDDYPAAAMAEIVNMFHRTRRSVCRAQMRLVGSHFLHQNPDVFIAKMPPKVEAEFLESVDASFWEHAEIAYIRIASYWDRVGQMLDFAFFSIRQFERDGFTAVVDRIHTNFGPMDSELKEMPEWKDLRAFQTSEREDGLKWLLRRRNLLVHWERTTNHTVGWVVWVSLELGGSVFGEPGCGSKLGDSLYGGAGKSWQDVGEVVADRYLKPTAAFNYR